MQHYKGHCAVESHRISEQFYIHKPSSQSDITSIFFTPLSIIRHHVFLIRRLPQPPTSPTVLQMPEAILFPSKRLGNSPPSSETHKEDPEAHFSHLHQVHNNGQEQQQPLQPQQQQCDQVLQWHVTEERQGGRRGQYEQQEYESVEQLQYARRQPQGDHFEQERASQVWQELCREAAKSPLLYSIIW